MRKLPKRINIAHLFTVIGLIGLVLVVVFNHRQFSLFIQVIHHVNVYLLIAVIFAQVFCYFINAVYYRSILRIFGYRMHLSRLFEGALAANFVNYILPTLGLAGAGYLSQVLAPEVSRAISVLTQLTRYAFSALSIVLMMPVGFGIIYLSGSSAHGVIHYMVIATISIIVLGAIILFCLAREAWLKKGVARCSHMLKRHFRSFPDQAFMHFIDEFYNGYHQLNSRPPLLLRPFGWSIAYILFEMATLYIVSIAFGNIINPGIIIIGFLFANIVSILGGVFFSSGVFELGMAGTFVALGAPISVAFAVTIVYRVMNLLIGLPLGYIFYRKYVPTD